LLFKQTSIGIEAILFLPNVSSRILASAIRSTAFDGVGVPGRAALKLTINTVTFVIL